MIRLLRENVEIVVADDLAKKYILEGFKPVEVEDVKPVENVVESDEKWALMPYQDLKRIAKEQGINSNGLKKTEIIEKLKGNNKWIEKK